MPKATLLRRVRMDSDTFDKALEKLWIHGGCTLDYEENATRGHEDWRSSYALQAERRRSQIDLVIQYARADQCRMSALVRHFDDVSDGRPACGICDFCSPEQCAAQRFRAPTEMEQQALAAVLQALRSDPSKSTGKLYKNLFPQEQLTRDAFEEVLGAMARAGLLHIQAAVFKKDGKTIPYRKASLTRDGYDEDRAATAELRMKAEADGPVSDRRARKKKSKGAKSPAKKKGEVVRESGQSASLEGNLRAWRLDEAKKRGVPAFRIRTDRALRAIASERPASVQELLSISGVGPATVKQYGAAIFRLCSSS